MDNISKIIFQETTKAFKKKKYNQVLALIAKLYERKNKNTIIDYLKAYSLYQLEQENEAIFILEEIIYKNKKIEFTIKASILLGYLYTKRKEYLKAKKYLVIPIKRKFSNPSPYSILGYIAHQEKDYALAEKYFKKTLSFEPENANFNNNLGYNYLIWKKKPKLAEKYIIKAFNQDKKNVNYLHSLGWLYFLNKKIKKSKEMLEKALSLENNFLVRKHYQEIQRTKP